jgi:hypothetical protein
MARLGLVLAVLLMTNGCGSTPSAPSDQPPDLRAAPTNVVLSGKRLQLGVSLWRDFMPIAPPDGRPLAGVLQVQTDDRSRVPADVRADAVWIVNGADLWSTVPREDRPSGDGRPDYEVIVRDGPKWGPNVGVDVVVRLVDAGGRTALLSARNQIIGATF